MPAQLLRRHSLMEQTMPRRKASFEEEVPPRGLEIGVLIKFLAALLAVLAPTVSFIWFAATQNAAIAANHQMETTAISATNVAVTQLQSDKKDMDKQLLEILVHLSSMDQSLKNIMTYGVPRPLASPESGNGNQPIILQQAPQAQPDSRR